MSLKVMQLIKESLFFNLYDVCGMGRGGGVLNNV